MGKPTCLAYVTQPPTAVSCLPTALSQVTPLGSQSTGSPSRHLSSASSLLVDNWRRKELPPSWNVSAGPDPGRESQLAVGEGSKVSWVGEGRHPPYRLRGGLEPLE